MQHNLWHKRTSHRQIYNGWRDTKLFSFYRYFVAFDITNDNHLSRQFRTKTELQIVANMSTDVTLIGLGYRIYCSNKQTCTVALLGPTCLSDRVLSVFHVSVFRTFLSYSGMKILLRLEWFLLFASFLCNVNISFLP